MKINVNITGIEDLNRALRELPKAMERGVLLATLREAAKVVRDEVRNTAPVKSGVLRRSIAIRSVPKRYSQKGPSVRVYARTGKGQSVDAYYAHIVELGAKPHRIPSESVGARKNKRKNPAMAFGGKVVSSVNHPGIKGRHFMNRAARSAYSRFVKAYEVALRPQMERFLARRLKRG